MSIYIGNNQITNVYMGSSEISSIYVGADLVYSGSTPPTPTGDTTNYLCFTSEQDGSSVKLTKVGSNAPTVSLEYSLDKATWNTWDRSAVTLNSGDTLYLRGNNTTFGVDNSNYNKFEITGYAGASGSIMTLLDKTDTSRSFSTTYTFVNLFRSCSGLTTAPELPATGLTKTCYQQTFIWCTSLTTAPELPATTLEESCYQGIFRGCTSLTTAPSILPATRVLKGSYLAMFYDCSGLTTAPALPATTVAESSYQEMFSNCTSLTTAPELPATTLATKCYQNMFYSCSNLSYIKCLATNISANSCLTNWVSGVSSTGTFVRAASMTSWPTGASGIPSGWTVVTQ